MPPATPPAACSRHPKSGCVTSKIQICQNTAVIPRSPKITHSIHYYVTNIDLWSHRERGVGIIAVPISEILICQVRSTFAIDVRVGGAFVMHRKCRDYHYKERIRSNAARTAVWRSIDGGQSEDSEAKSE